MKTINLKSSVTDVTVRAFAFEVLTAVLEQKTTAKDIAAIAAQYNLLVDEEPK
jgi:hypothetical protein